MQRKKKGSYKNVSQDFATKYRDSRRTDHDVNRKQVRSNRKCTHDGMGAETRLEIVKQQQRYDVDTNQSKKTNKTVEVGSCDLPLSLKVVGSTAGSFSRAVTQIMSAGAAGTQTWGVREATAGQP